MSLIGYGTAAQGASVTQLNATQWSINSADGTIHDIITLANGASIDTSDVTFIAGAGPAAIEAAFDHARFANVRLCISDTFLCFISARLRLSIIRLIA
jgi:hypothetical protein